MDTFDLEIDPATFGTPTTYDAAEVEVPAAPVAVLKRDVPPGVVDQEGVRRATADEKAARAMGLSLAPPVFQLGTRVIELGAENFKASRDEWDALPMVDQACDLLIATVQAEKREDIGVEIPSLSMADDGRLVIPGESPHPLTRRAIEGLASFTTAEGGGGGYLAGCPADLRATNFNHWFPLGYRVDKRATDKAVPVGQEATEDQFIYTAKKVTLRTRNSGEAREVFATVGPRYGSFDIDRVADKIKTVLAGKDVRADVTYDGYKARWNILQHSNIQPETCVAGEIFKTGIVVNAADDGSGSINVAMCAWRNLCLNLIIIDFDKVLVGRRRHSGKAETIEQKISEFMLSAHEKMAYFAKAWDAASTEDILEKYDLGNPRDVFRGLVLNKVVGVAGYTTDEMVNRLMSAYEAEPGYTKSAFINAITRSAHESEWKSWEDAGELESTAGKMLFQQNWDYVVPPKERTVESVLGGF